MFTSSLNEISTDQLGIGCLVARKGGGPYFTLVHPFIQGSDTVVMNSWSQMVRGLNRLLPKEIRSRHRQISEESQHRGGQAPWLVGRPAYADRISDIQSKVLNYRNFSKNFLKRSKPKHRPNSRHSIETVKLSKFFAKKKGFKYKHWIFKAL